MKKIIFLFLFCINCYSGMYFDGSTSNYIYGDDFFYSNNITITAWVKYENAQRYCPIVCKTQKPGGILYNGNGTFEWMLYIDAVNFSQLSWTGWNNNPNTLFDFNSSISVTTNVWTFVAGRYDGSTASNFVNTIKTDSVVSGTIFNSTSAINIGGRYSTVINNILKGQIEEVAIWDLALTDNEINLLANAKIKGLCKQIRPGNLKLYIPLNSIGNEVITSSQTIIDRSGNNYNMTSEGAKGKANEILTYP